MLEPHSLLLHGMLIPYQVTYRLLLLCAQQHYYKLLTRLNFVQAVIYWLSIAAIFITIGGRKRGMRRGVPNVLMELDNRTRKIHPQLLPSTTTAIQQYSLNGGTISNPCWFGVDPLQNNHTKMMIRHEAFSPRYSFKSLFCDVSSGCGSSFSGALKFLIDVTFRLANS